LEQLLRDLPRVGSLVKDRGYRQVWRFECEGKAYYLKFYPRQASPLKRLFRGNPALREFTRLQALQKAAIPAPRPVAHLVGFKLAAKSAGVPIGRARRDETQIGDAVILEAIEPAIQLDRYLNDFLLNGEPIPDHGHLVQQILHLLHQLARAKLGHTDLHLGNMLMHEGKIYLLDGYAVRTGGLTIDHVMQMAHSVRSLATRADLQRGWNELGPGGKLPTYNPISTRQWRKFIERTRGQNDYFGKLGFDAWRGIFFKHYKFPRRWAPASKLNVRVEDWQREWPRLWEKMISEQMEPLKRSRSGDVWAGEIVLDGRPISIIVKRPYKRYWYRYINEIGRGDRAWRAWHKAWNLVIRDLPTAWPLAVFWKRELGYVTDSLIVFERVPGKTLADVDLDAIAVDQREMLFRRTGGILRKIEEFGFAHFDAKANNWIVQDDPKLGPRPILIDVDGIRFRRWRALGIERLLRSMRHHQQYTPADSLALCQGYAPYSTTMIRQNLDEQADASANPNASSRTDAPGHAIAADTADADQTDTAPSANPESAEPSPEHDAGH
jgi:tRNA A-37 threonylcarbamoyl transferase component Bud32